MKPTRNRVYCPSAQRQKMVFASQEKAENFLLFNSEEMAIQSNVVPIRAYYCPACGGWHVTHVALSEKYIDRDGKEEASVLLEKLCEDMKRNFRKDLWQEWEERYDLAKGIMALLSDTTEYLQLLQSKAGMMAYYGGVIEKERNKAMLAAHPDYKERIHVLQQEIFHKLSGGSFVGVPVLGMELKELMDVPLATYLPQGKRLRLTALARWLTDTNVLPLFEKGYRCLEELHTLLTDGYSEADVLLQELEGVVTEVEHLGVSNEIVAPLQNGVRKIKHRLENPGDSGNKKDQQTDAPVSASSAAAECRATLVKAIECLTEGNRSLAEDLLDVCHMQLECVPPGKEKEELCKALQFLDEKVSK